MTSRNPTTANRDFSRLSNHLNTYESGYNQALFDFAINTLISQLHSQGVNTVLQTQEVEQLAALLIARLADSLDENLISSYLGAIRQQQTDLLSLPINLDYAASVDNPDTFSTPRFQIGDELRYIPEDEQNPIDKGQVLGYYYCYAAHRGSWMWRYILWLKADSPSAGWLKATTAWENDLEVDNV